MWFYLLAMILVPLVLAVVSHLSERVDAPEAMGTPESEIFVLRGKLDQAA